MTRLQQTAKPFQLRAWILFLAFVGIYFIDTGRLWASPVLVGKTVKQPGLLIRTSLTDSPVGRIEKRFSEVNSKKSRSATTPGALSASAISGLIIFSGQSQFASHIERSPSLISISPSSDRAPPRI
jgi:hypothetical protein